MGVKLKHASGNGTVLGAPAANPSADITLKVPSTTGSAGQALKIASANHSSTNAELEWGADSGKVLQIVQHTSQTQTLITSDTNFFSGAITPTATSSYILLQAVICIGAGSNMNGGVCLKRDSTAINVAAGQVDSSVDAFWATDDFFNTGNNETKASLTHFPVLFLDKGPSNNGIGTTSSVTYSFNTTSITQLAFNRTVLDASYGKGTSILQLWEVTP